MSRMASRSRSRDLSRSRRCSARLVVLLRRDEPASAVPSAVVSAVLCLGDASFRLTSEARCGFVVRSASRDVGREEALLGHSDVIERGEGRSARRRSSCWALASISADDRREAVRTLISAASMFGAVVCSLGTGPTASCSRFRKRSPLSWSQTAPTTVSGKLSSGLALPAVLAIV